MSNAPTAGLPDAPAMSADDRAFAARRIIAAARFQLAQAAELLDGQKYAKAVRDVADDAKYLADRIGESRG